MATIPALMKKTLIILFFGLSFALSGTSTLAQSQSSESSGGFWSKIIETLISGVSNINVDSATLGVDKGLITNAIVGIGRTVERNPRSTSNKDRYLVKDRLRLGIQLGAGYVIAGAASYVQEWTLVYPVETELQGMLSRKFILDLFLPMTINRLEDSKLPAEYVVIRESAIEGKGRIRFGDLPAMPLGSEHSIGKVKLATTLTKRFPNQTYRIMQETSKFYKIANSLWLDLQLFDVPIFDMAITGGHSERNFYEIDYKGWNRYDKKNLYSAVFKGYLNPMTNEIQNKLGIIDIEKYLEPYKLDEKWKSKFHQRTSSFTFFDIFNSDSITRRDDITLSRGGESANWYQWEDRRNNDWSIGISGETYSSRILFSARKDKANKDRLIDPILSVNIIIKDSHTSKKELQAQYIGLTKDLLKSAHRSDDFADYENQVTPSSYKDISSELIIKAFYEKEDLDTLILTHEKQWQKEVAKATGKSWSYWDKAMHEKLHSLERRRLRRSRVPLADIIKGRDIKEFLEFLARAREKYSENPLEAYRSLCWAFRTSFYVSSMGGNNIFLLKAINEVLAKKNRDQAKIYVHHEIFSEDMLETKATLITEQGLMERMDQVHFPYILQDPTEIYYFF